MKKEAWNRFLEGDEKSFSDLYQAYFGVLFAYATKLGFNEDTSKDAIQDVFYKIYISQKQLSHIKDAEFYLIQCLKNRLFDIHNSEAKIDYIDYDKIIIESGESVVESIIEKENQSLLKDKIKQSIATLPPRQRKIIYFHYQLNLSFDEIATLLEMTPEAVKKSAYRAILKLKETHHLKNSHLFHLLSLI